MRRLDRCRSWAFVAVMALSMIAEAQASEWSYASEEMLSFVFFKLIPFVVLVNLVSLVVASRRHRGGDPDAWLYMLVPAETIAFSVAVLFLISVGRGGLGQDFAAYATIVPWPAWAAAHFLHRRREPEFRYRGGRRRGRD